MFLYHFLSMEMQSDSTELIVSAVLIYDLFAFVTELPLGAFLDRRKNVNGLIASAGCAVIALIDMAGAFDMIPLSFFIPAAVIMGIGNAAFHLGAGVDVINLADRKAAFPGIFISTGAMGLFLGTGSASMHYDNLFLMGVSLMAVSCYLMWRYFREIVYISGSDGTVIHTGKRYVFLAVLFLFLVIFYRSFLGFASKYSWRSGFWIGLAAVSAVVLGKITGGIAADRFGWKRTIGVSLAACALAAFFSETSVLAGCLVLFLFNMTMPVAMTGLTNLLPEWKGFAFGINTTALFLGFITYRITGKTVSGTVLCVMILLSALVLYASIYLAPEMEG